MSQVLTRNKTVSSDGESLILVDGDDRELGFLDKSACHDGAGVLHRAFSLFVFNEHGELLIQQRAEDKRLWPSYWSNSCCSHPRRGETMETAVGRRLEEELGLNILLRYLYKFEYSASFGDLGTEHELCSVYTGFAGNEPVINTAEIASWQWIDRDLLTSQLDAEPERFTPWFKMEWERLRREFPIALRVPE
ncbi:MAG: isopentenyl-diphosphate Delta-isomerase [Gammaproteobacteria bacterium]|nr:isopentenyl-diphosphate Delta-isomerase [Gammaproteobacteria bacterium]